MEPIKQYGQAVSAYQAEIRPVTLDFNFASQPAVQPSPVQDVISILEKHLAEEDKKRHEKPNPQKDAQENDAHILDLDLHNAGKSQSGNQGDDSKRTVSNLSERDDGTDSKFKYVMVDQNGAPDWSKVLNLDKDIIREVFEKHGIKMGDASKGGEGHKKAKKKKKSKSQKKAKMEKLSGQQDKKIQCTQCDKTFRLKRNLRDHMRYHDARRYECTYCKYVAVRQKELEYHLNSHTGNRPFVCDICNKGFGHPTVLSSHKKTHRGHTGTVSCEICRMDFAQPHLLDRHMQTHSEERPHRCAFCSNDFKREMDLRKHIKLYHSEVSVDDIFPKQPTPEGDFKCTQCERSFQTEAGLEQHQRRTHNSRKTAMLESDDQAKQKYTCEQCFKVFDTIKMFTKHKVSHSTIRPYTCSICGRSFKRQWELHKHKLIHSKQPLIPCPNCNAQFPGRINLRRHIIRMHRVDAKKPVLKPFQCEVCNRPYARKAELEEHMNIHTGARPYICDTCGRTFSFRSSLACHRKLHADEGGIQCDICGKRFGSKIRMKEHRVIHTGEKPFVCQHCGSSYRYPSNLRWHLNKAHKRGPCGGRPRQRKPTANKANTNQAADIQPQQVLVPLELAEAQYQAVPQPQQEQQQLQDVTMPHAQTNIPMQVHYHEVQELATSQVLYENAVEPPPNVYVQEHSMMPLRQQGFNQQDLMAVAEIVLETPEGSKVLQAEDGSFIIDTSQLSQLQTTSS